MREVKIYPTALTANTVSSLYSEGMNLSYTGGWISANHVTDKILYHQYGDYGSSLYIGDPAAPSTLIIENATQLRNFLNNAVLTTTSAYNIEYTGY